MKANKMIVMIASAAMAVVVSACGSRNGDSIGTKSVEKTVQVESEAQANGGIETEAAAETETIEQTAVQTEVSVNHIDAVVYNQSLQMHLSDYKTDTAEKLLSDNMNDFQFAITDQAHPNDIKLEQQAKIEYADGTECKIKLDGYDHTAIIVDLDPSKLNDDGSLDLTVYFNSNSRCPEIASIFDDNSYLKQQRTK